MGVKLTDIISYRVWQWKDLKGRIIGVDAFNTIYQFISIIRQKDGAPLQDSSGNIVSHLSGLLQRTANFVDVGIKPVFVFDGKAPVLKKDILNDRKERKILAQKAYEAALEQGDLVTARSKASQTARLTCELIEESKLLLTYMGVPCIQAPSEGEAQASWMAQQGLVWGVASQDYDAVLFGAPFLVRNLTGAKRRRLPGGGTKTVELQIIELSRVLSSLDLTREQLIDIGILIGTDFFEGAKGIGPKTGLKLIKQYGSIEEIMHVTDKLPSDFDLELAQQVRQFFMKPPVDENIHDIEWPRLNEDGLYDLLCNKHDFSPQRMERSIMKLGALDKQNSQGSLDQWC